MSSSQKTSHQTFWGEVDDDTALQQFNLLVDSVYDGIYQLDSEGRFVGVNRMIVEVTGFSRDQLLGEHVSLLLDDRDIDRVKRDFRQRLTDGRDISEPATYEITFESAVGETVICDLRITPLITDGEFLGSIGIVRDITERRQRERHIQSELEEVVDRITDGFLGVDTGWNITHINERGTQILDAADDELIGKNFWEEFPETIDTGFERAFRRAMETQEATTIEGYYRPLGIWLENSMYPSETGVSVYFRDITRRKEREQELRERQSQLEKYEQMFETIRDGVYVLDKDRRFVMVNNAFVSMTRYSREELVGTHASVVFGDEIGVVEDAHVDSDEATTSASFEERIQTATGETITIESRFTLLPDEDGSELRVGVARDITQRKMYERALRESNERLEQFAHAASHDLQEPLRMVTSYLRLLERRYADVLDEDANEFIEFAVDGAERMKSMVDALLEYSRVESRGAPFEPLDLNEILDEVLEDLQVTIAERDVQLSVDDLPRVEGDAVQLRQLFQNLVTNAIQYSDGQPEISVSAELDDGIWVISIRDNGIGIDPEHHERIFEIFQRLTTLEEHSGSGIGLALCQRIVERHGGTIRVHSTPGEGSTFSFTIPATAVEQSD